MAEVYKLSWTPSVSAKARLQDVTAVIDGVETLIAVDQPMLVTEVEYTFSADAVVVWEVTTYNADKSKQAVSASNTFTVTDQEPLLAATGLSATWLRHVV
jgi:hypothetical protein